MITFDATKLAENIKLDAQKQALDEYNTAVEAMIGKVSQAELASWAKQEAEARNLTGATPLIDGLIVSRGLAETREELAAKIIANSNAYTAGYAQVLGTYQAKLKAIV